MKTLFELSPAYFGAANSFNGFKSNFDKIFNPVDYERIYILKGGPGSGKSTLMKRISESLLKNGGDLTRIYCSSDPKSLDGVIIALNSKRIAIIDGTAPHVTEANYPGAVEIIVNLGEGFNTSELAKRKNEIIEYSNQKRHAYSQAYECLKICGDLSSNIFDKFKTNTVYSEAESICNQILQYELFREKYTQPTHNYWIGAFCKYGYTRLDIPCFDKEYISIRGDGFTEQIVMNILLEHLASERAVNLVAKSAYTPQYIDAIITCSCIISTDNCGSVSIDTSLLSRLLDKETEKLKQVYADILKIANQHLNCASEYHFMLEDIYTANMDFSYNDTVTKRIQTEILDLLL